MSLIRSADSEIPNSVEENEDELLNVRVYYFSVISVFQSMGY
jgi:hypothetical protein